MFKILSLSCTDIIRPVDRLKLQRHVIWLQLGSFLTPYINATISNIQRAAETVFPTRNSAEISPRHSDPAVKQRLTYQVVKLVLQLFLFRCKFENFVIRTSLRLSEVR
jgi:hypothetical protein